MSSLNDKLFSRGSFFCPKSLRHKILLTSIRVSGSFLVSFLLLPKISVRPRRAKNCCERHFCFRRTYKKIFCSSFFVPGLSVTRSLSLAFTLCPYLPRASLSLFPLSSLPHPGEFFLHPDLDIFYFGAKKGRLMKGSMIDVCTSVAANIM